MSACNSSAARIGELWIIDVHVGLSITATGAVGDAREHGGRRARRRPPRWRTLGHPHPGPRRRPAGTMSTVGPDAAASLAPIRRPSCRVLRRRRSHEGDRRVVDEERPSLERWGHRVAGSEVDHVERTEAHDLGNACRPRRRESIGAGREHATDQLVGYSVVVRSSTPAMALDLASASRARPPEPVA